MSTGMSEVTRVSVQVAVDLCASVHVQADLCASVHIQVDLCASVHVCDVLRESPAHGPVSYSERNDGRCVRNEKGGENSNPQSKSTFAVCDRCKAGSLLQLATGALLYKVPPLVSC